MVEVDKILRTGIWHFTSLHALRSILKDQFILPNINHRFKLTYPQTSNSVALKNNCISLFDLANIKDEIYYDRDYKRQRQSIIYAHEPFSIGLNLNRSQLTSIIPYEKIEKKIGVIIGHMECIYPEPISVLAIDRILVIDNLTKTFAIINDNFTYDNVRIQISKMIPAHIEKYKQNKHEENLKKIELYKAVLKRRNELENNKIDYGK